MCSSWACEVYAGVLQVAHLHEAALAEDATVFDYDGVYDSIQAQRVQPRQAEKLARKSRYIETLMDKAVERKKEEDIVYERKCGDHLHPTLFHMFWKKLGGNVAPGVEPAITVWECPT
jgi:hypothetical protein